MTFPLVQRAVQRDLASVGARVGWVQLANIANIAGNAAGSVGTGLVSLHLLGTAGTLRLLAVLSLALLGWFWHEQGARLSAPRRRRVELALAAACAVLAAVLPGNAAFWRRMHAQPPGSDAAWSEDRSGVAFWRDSRRDAGARPAAPPRPAARARHRRGQRRYPLGRAGQPGGAAVAGGRAGPAGAGQARRRGADFYDVIEADAILPQASHSGVLYSREFLERVRARLAPDGLYVQWAPTRRAAETFAAVFPHVVLLKPAGILIGSERPLLELREILLQRPTDPVIARHLARGNPAAGDLSATIADPPETWLPGDQRSPAPLTDMSPRDEFFLNRPN